jgi:hypothetical protein
MGLNAVSGSVNDPPFKISPATAAYLGGQSRIKVPFLLLLASNSAWLRRFSSSRKFWRPSAWQKSRITPARRFTPENREQVDEFYVPDADRRGSNTKRSVFIRVRHVKIIRLTNAKM